MANKYETEVRMASNETVAEIREDVNEYLTSIGPGEYPDETQFEEFADRFEAAHKREILVERHLADEYLAAKDAEIAELRECLRLSSNSMEMVVQWLGKYPKWQEGLKDGVARNRKALEGANNGTKR